MVEVHNWDARDTASTVFHGTPRAFGGNKVHEISYPRHMQYRDVAKACKTAELTLAPDPLDQYLNGTPDSLRWKLGRKVTFHLQFCKVVREKSEWTINHGESIMNLGDPARQEDAVDKIINAIHNRLVRGLNQLTYSKEQRLRSAEFGTKMRKAIRDTLGERTAYMIEVGSLATSPECQGRGYASSLVRVATNLADARGVPSWLVSSNTANRGFYHSLGFEVVTTFHVGDGNPTWTAAPVPVDIMVRHPKSMGDMWNEKTGVPAL
ncbi:GNAT family N-acetyltransferase [Phanerochaete sordida]|uniref:GNAT family N-acetyltransferase n=1 Tax=Phanerochaete sordida TaxID=48140 RepID=A0A9P3LHR4_9APHY|nr:GNAT family N-acetyltransferase [Phanerochaete sordida]